ncbi:protein REVEILLE 8-like [Panicum virgatum]|uniref:protein REVEILLE 8-like n=1 Tax=Panicum virgatum TaxID=38727 RepID=UPI0019D59115|nr:protein REVEILLE 8-like [Panicum virgatum]
MAAARRNNSSAGTAAAAGKKPRKPYKITRPPEKWAADEHGRFLHALLLFGRDWKPVAQFVGTKTATQVRSHAQKHYLKAQKLGLGAALPPRRPCCPLSQPRSP